MTKPFGVVRHDGREYLVHYPDGIPRWFTWLWHHVSWRQCTKRGQHLNSTSPGQCGWCGAFVGLN